MYSAVISFKSGAGDDYFIYHVHVCFALQSVCISTQLLIADHLTHQLTAVSLWLEQWLIPGRLIAVSLGTNWWETRQDYVRQMDSGRG